MVQIYNLYGAEFTIYMVQNLQFTWCRIYNLHGAELQFKSIYLIASIKYVI